MIPSVSGISQGNALLLIDLHEAMAKKAQLILRVFSVVLSIIAFISIILGLFCSGGGMPFWKIGWMVAAFGEVLLATILVTITLCMHRILRTRFILPPEAIMPFAHLPSHLQPSTLMHPSKPEVMTTVSPEGQLVQTVLPTVPSGISGIPAQPVSNILPSETIQVLANQGMSGEQIAQVAAQQQISQVAQGIATGLPMGIAQTLIQPEVVTTVSPEGQLVQTVLPTVSSGIPGVPAQPVSSILPGETIQILANQGMSGEQIAQVAAQQQISHVAQGIAAGLPIGIVQTFIQAEVMTTVSPEGQLAQMVLPKVPSGIPGVPAQPVSSILSSETIQILANQGMTGEQIAQVAAQQQMSKVLQLGALVQMGLPQRSSGLKMYGGLGVEQLMQRDPQGLGGMVAGQLGVLGVQQLMQMGQQGIVTGQLGASKGLVELNLPRGIGGQRLLQMAQQGMGQAGGVGGLLQVVGGLALGGDEEEGESGHKVDPNGGWLKQIPGAGSAIGMVGNISGALGKKMKKIPGMGVFGKALITLDNITDADDLEDIQHIAKDIKNEMKEVKGIKKKK